MKGFAFLEVLITLFIISFAILGSVHMQHHALENAEDTYLKNLAITQLNSLMERLRANHSEFARINELDKWNQLNSEFLPKAHGNFSCDKNKQCSVEIAWFFKNENKLTLDALVQ